jgi:3-hydroxyacyl-CoA dehydrogenase
MVIWSGDAPFSVGADLEATMPAFVIGGADAIESIEQELQNLMLRLRYAQVPVVAAIHGMALGGGCELAVYSAAAWPTWKAISAWWKWAWAWCPAPAA